MNALWNRIDLLPFSRNTKYCLYSLAAGLIAAAAGLLLWCAVRVFCLNSVDWAVCFAGCPFFFASLAALIRL